MKTCRYCALNVAFVSIDQEIRAKQKFAKNKTKLKDVDIINIIILVKVNDQQAIQKAVFEV